MEVDNVNEKDKNVELLLIQWQTCVEMANSVSCRRDTMNNLYITGNLAILTSISIITDLKNIFVLICGIITCFIWLHYINNFKTLNEEKFKVINKLEMKLPAQPFNDE